MASVAVGVSAPSKPEVPVKDDSLAVFKALAEASAVFLALTFIGGWSYLSAYYKTFGLNPLELDFPIPVVSTIALYVLYESVWPLCVLTALFVALALLPRRKLRGGWVVVALGVLLVTTSTAGLFHGRRVASQDMLNQSSTLPYVAFATKLRISGPSCVDSGTLGSLDCKLLLHNKNSYYFFEPIPKEHAGNMNLFILADSDVAQVHIQRGIENAH